MLSENEITNYIKDLKYFWKVRDFKREILDWSFNTNLDLSSNNIVIGHPKTSHKGTSLGDILPYTRLPELLYEKYKCNIFVPEWFYPLFKYNPYVTGIDNRVSRWGSLGTWGTTVQRTSNVLGCHTFNFRPIVYQKSKINNLDLFEDIIKNLRDNGYYCIQLSLDNEYHIKSANSYIFNASLDTLIEILRSSFCYIGAQNSIYHLTKALGRKVIGILPENIDPFYVMLPLLTQTNHLELEMLSEEERERSNIWIKWMQLLGKDPNNSHHIGWLYPDSCHLTMNSSKVNSYRCPFASFENILKAINDDIYPFNDPRLWDVTSKLWI